MKVNTSRRAGRRAVMTERQKRIVAAIAFGSFSEARSSCCGGQPAAGSDRALDRAEEKPDRYRSTTSTLKLTRAMADVGPFGDVSRPRFTGPSLLLFAQTRVGHSSFPWSPRAVTPSVPAHSSCRLKGSCTCAMPGWDRHQAAGAAQPGADLGHAGNRAPLPRRAGGELRQTGCE